MKDIKLTPEEAVCITGKRDEYYFAEALLNTFTEKNHTFYRACREVIENMEAVLENSHPYLTDNDKDLICNNGLELWVDDSSDYDFARSDAADHMFEVIYRMPVVREEIARIYSSEEVRAECMCLAECLLYLIEEQILNRQIYKLENNKTEVCY